jgi:PAS domain S-box-containing protein
MSFRPLISDSEKDKHKSRDQLIKELSELRAELAARGEGLEACEHVVGMLDGITEPILALDDASRVVYANPAAARLLAKDGDTIEGRSFWDLYPKSHETLFYNAYEKARAARSKGKFRESHRLLDKWFDVYLYPVPGGMTVLFNDITVSRQLEELPRLALTLLHNLKDNVFLMRADGRLFHVNNETQHSLGYSSDELHRMSIFDVVPSSYANEWHDILDRIRQHGSMTFESRLCGKAGREFPVEVYANYIELYGKNYYTISARDITDRKNAEEILEKYRLFSENARDIALFVMRDGRILEANLAAVEAYGYTREELLSLTVYDLRAGDPGYAVDMQMDTAFDNGILFETLHRRKDGSIFPVEVNSQGRVIRGQRVLLSIIRDITVRKRIEEALIDAEDFNRSVLDSLPSNIAVLDETGTIIYVNNGWKKFGIENAGSPECAKGVGINYFDVCRSACGPHSTESPAALTGMMSVLSGENDLFEMEYPCDSPATRRWFQMRVTPFSGRKTHGIVVYHNDITARKMAEEVLSESEAELARAQQISHIGSWTWDLITDELNWSDESYRNYGLIPGEVKPSYDLFLSFIVPEDRERVDNAVRRAIDTGEKYNVIYTVIRKDGVPRMLLSENEIITDGSGKVVKMYGTNQDITERKKAEEALQIAKTQAELYVDLMSHDINNMNQVAMASLEIALMDLEQDGKLDTSGIPLLERSLESLNNSSALIRNVQKLQRASMEGIKLQAVDVADVLREIIDEQRSAPGKKVTIYYKNEATHCLVTANELLRDVFTNIISNAINHARTDRHLTIGVTMESVIGGGRKFCRVTIDDNGSGIPDEVKGRLFRRFSRGETKAKGSGLGLYLVKTLVEHYGGDIRVEDRISGDHTRGAKFIVTIPSAE